ncbi:T3SS effector HopA1 family protein [Nonomuraea sp. NPDC050556]|uniref:T3SS effector HopA1 family protein n=1 Tax=Nonomuraea sp. NPDC050556 TaxID=3364369 RepID=UPI0037B80DFF
MTTTHPEHSQVKKKAPASSRKKVRVQPAKPSRLIAVVDDDDETPTRPARRVAMLGEEESPLLLAPSVPLRSVSKRDLLPHPDDQARYDLNRKSARTTLDEIYDQYYNGMTGRRRSSDEVERSIYSLMGTARSDYAKVPISDAQWKSFNAQKNATIVAQGVGNSRAAWQKYRHDLARYNSSWDKYNPFVSAPVPPKGPENNEQAIARGDYFRVYNANGDSRNKKGRMRRIIVNVNSQKAGLNVADALNKLFVDPVTAKHFWQYKIYLSKKPGLGGALIKHDKLVLYYGLADPEDTSSDPVGDRIVDAISGAIGKDDVGEGFAPFYSRVSPGIAWAEEPKAFVDALKRSFTRTRAEIIQGVIKKKEVIGDKDEFERLVYEALEKAKVDPERPHRHIREA